MEGWVWITVHPIMVKVALRSHTLGALRGQNEIVGISRTYFVS